MKLTKYISILLTAFLVGIAMPQSGKAMTPPELPPLPGINILGKMANSNKIILDSARMNDP